MRAEDDAITRLQSQQCLVEDSRSWVGCWDDTSKDAERLSIGGDTIDAVLVDEVAGLLVLVLIVDVLRTVVVLDDLVLNQADLGVLNGHLSEGDTMVVRLVGCPEEDLVDLFLVQLQELKMSLVNFFHEIVKLFDSLDWNL